MDEITGIHEDQNPSPKADPLPSNDLKSHIDLSHTCLTENQQDALLSILQQYRDVFALSPDELGRTDVIKYIIDIRDSPPIRVCPYRVPEIKKATVDEHINEMLQRGIICESTSPWSAPVVLVGDLPIN